ncbi:uracil-DNA glycosylase family protein [Actinomarinicola tropica]|nr:hypothetical protein [Actinomarinicola tropica]
MTYWNIVPWYLGDGRKIAPATDAGYRASQAYLLELMNLLP